MCHFLTIYLNFSKNTNSFLALSFLSGFTQVAWELLDYLHEPTEKQDWITNNAKS